MKIFLLMSAAALIIMGAPAYGWDDRDDSGYNSSYGYSGTFDRPSKRGLYKPAPEPAEKPYVPAYDNPFAKSKDRGLFYETPIHKEDRVRLNAPRKVKKEDDPYYKPRTRHNNSISEGVLRSLEKVR